MKDTETHESKINRDNAIAKKNIHTTIHKTQPVLKTKDWWQNEHYRGDLKKCDPEVKKDRETNGVITSMHVSMHLMPRWLTCKSMF